MSTVCPLDILVFGAGSMADCVLPALRQEYLNITAFLDERPHMSGTVHYYRPVVGLHSLSSYAYEYILVLCKGADSIAKGLENNWGIPKEKIVPFDFPELFFHNPNQRYTHAHLAFVVESYLRQYPGMFQGFNLHILLRHPLFADRITSGIAISDAKKAADLLIRNGFHPALIGEMRSRLVSDIPKLDDYVRYATLSALAYEIHSRHIVGSIAEFGVWRGDFAACIRKLFPDRKLYLFDTFAGFDPEQKQHDEKHFQAVPHDFSGTSVATVLQKIGSAENCVIKKGFFPDTAADVEDCFAFVSLDVDLYQPTLDGLSFFYPRLSEGGYILVHDYSNPVYQGCNRAVREFCERENIACVPVGDAWGSAIICKATECS